jgi:glucokinase
VSNYYAGIDLGGTKILALIADDAGHVLGDARIATPAKQGPEAVIAQIVAAVGDAAREAGIEVRSLAALGVSAPGPIDAGAGVITDPPNLPGWHNVPLARILHERLGAPAHLENDANCQGVAEHQFGAGRGLRHMIFVTISTGIGGGIIIDNELYAGESGAAGEVGHMPVDIDGRRTCGAGHPGCLEAYASGTAIAAIAREEIAAGGLPRTARIAEREPPLSAETVYRAAMEGEAQAMAIIHSAGRYLGMGLASLINIFNPQAIILGGGLVNMGEAILGPAVETARTRSFGQSFQDVRIVEGELGDRAGALGAIAIARGRAGRPRNTGP